MLVYLAFRALVLLSAILPHKTACQLMGWLTSTVVARFAKMRNNVAIKNLEIIHGNNNAYNRPELLKKFWRNIGYNIADFPRLKSIKINDFDNLFNQFPDSQYIFLTPHLGQWELSASFLTKGRLSYNVFVRGDNNPYIANYLRKIRHHYKAEQNNGYYNKSESVAGLKDSIKNKKILFFLFDHKLNTGIDFQLFGEQCKAMTTPFDISVKYKLPIYFVSFIRNPDLVSFTAHIKLFNVADYGNDSFKLMRAVNDKLEQCVRENPEQWLLFHRRFPKEIYN